METTDALEQDVELRGNVQHHVGNAFTVRGSGSWLRERQRWPVGGALFGFGMTLGSGCGSRSLIRLGSGNLKSLVVVVFLALAAYMTLRGVLAVVRVNVFDVARVALPAAQDLPSLIATSGVAVTTARWVVSAIVAVARNSRSGC